MWAGGGGPPSGEGKRLSPPKACTQKFEGQWEGHQPREGGRCWGWWSGPSLLRPGEGKLGRKGGGAPLGNDAPLPDPAGCRVGPEEAP